jgi:hypothetical protein
MSDRSPALLPTLRQGSGHRLFHNLGPVFGESTLALGPQFSTGLLELLLELRVLSDESPHGFPFVSQLAMQHVDGLRVLIRSRHHHAQTGAAEMRAMPNIRAAVFQSGVEEEFHRNPFRVRG